MYDIMRHLLRYLVSIIFPVISLFQVNFILNCMSLLVQHIRHLFYFASDGGKSLCTSDFLSNKSSEFPYYWR